MFIRPGLGLLIAVLAAAPVTASLLLFAYALGLYPECVHLTYSTCH